MDNNETKPKKNIGKGLKIGIAAVGLCLILTFAWQCASCYIFPYKVEGKVWTYYVQKNGSVRLTGMNPKAVPADGVLYIPNKIGGRKVSGFGQITSSVGLPGGTHGDMFRIPRMEKVTLAKGVPVDDWFWGAGRIIELESKTAENIWFKSTQRLIIVPDGCRDVYITAMEKQQQRLSTMHRVVEKTESIGLEWLIDGDGLLKAYFGLQTEHLVFPEGIKKLDGGSLGGGGGFTPQTIILNEDLEEIGKSSLRFGLEEITIPKSVKYIDEGAITAKTIYLFRSTKLHEQAFWPNAGKEFVYLD